MPNCSLGGSATCGRAMKASPALQRAWARGCKDAISIRARTFETRKFRAESRPHISAQYRPSPDEPALPRTTRSGHLAPPTAALGRGGADQSAEGAGEGGHEFRHPLFVDRGTLVVATADDD